MNKTLKKKWVKALLSGEYKQGRDYLFYNGRYCCLGVLEKVATGKEPPRTWGLFDAPWEALGLSYSQVSGLAGVNDSGVPFDMIAGLIDEAL